MANLKETKMTQEGYDELERELDYLKGEKRKEVAEKIKVARSYGDLSENSEYDDAMNEQGLLERRIQTLEATLKNAVVISSDELSNKKVHVGSKVQIEEQKSGKKFEYKIVGSSESNPKEGKLSDESPIGAALIDHKKNDVIDVETPSGSKKFKILKITK